MSYSFSVRASSKSEVGAQVAAEFDKVVASQPVHAADKQAVNDAAQAFVGILRDPGEGEYVGVSVSGSLTWSAPDDAANFTGSSISVSAYVAKS